MDVCICFDNAGNTTKNYATCTMWATGATLAYQYVKRKPSTGNESGHGMVARMLVGQVKRKWPRMCASACVTRQRNKRAPGVCGPWRLSYVQKLRKKKTRWCAVVDGQHLRATRRSSLLPRAAP